MPLFLFLPGLLHRFDGGGLGAVGYVDIGFHGLVVGMAGEFHDDLGRDADGEHEADKGLAAAVGADEGVLGVGLVVAVAVAETGDVDRGGEAAELAEVLEVLVHLLVGDDGQGEVVAEAAVLVVGEDGEGVLVELDLEAGVGLLRGDGEDAVLDVVEVDVGHVRVAQAGEGAEAEEVAGLGEGAGLLDGLFVGAAAHVLELDFGAAFGDLVVVECVEFLLGEEDDGLLGGLEDGMVEGDVGEVDVALLLGPVEEGGEDAVLLAGGGVFEVAGEAEVVDIGDEAFAVEVAEGDGLAVFGHVGLEGPVHFDGFVGPAGFAGAFLEVFVDVVVGGALVEGEVGGCGGFVFGDVDGVAGVDGGDEVGGSADGFGELGFHLVEGRELGSGEVVGFEVGPDVGDAFVDGFGVLAEGVDVELFGFFDLLFFRVPLLGVAGKADGLHQAGAAHIDGDTDGSFAGFVEFFFEVKGDLHGPGSICKSCRNFVILRRFKVEIVDWR